jgi:hypothetical protein
MRLFEVEDHFANDLVTVLRNQLGRGDAKHTSLVLSYDALSNIMKNMGYGKMDYNGFKKMYDDNTDLQSIVQNFNADKVVLSTKTQPNKDQEKLDTPTGPSVDQMAHSAVNTPPAI